MDVDSVSYITEIIDFISMFLYFQLKKTHASSYTYISCLDKELVKQHKLYKLYTYILYVIRDETLCLRADIHWKYSYLLDNLNT